MHYYNECDTQAYKPGYLGNQRYFENTGKRALNARHLGCACSHAPAKPRSGGAGYTRGYCGYSMIVTQIPFGNIIYRSHASSPRDTQLRHIIVKKKVRTENLLINIKGQIKSVKIQFPTKVVIKKKEGKYAKIRFLQKNK